MVVPKESDRETCLCKIHENCQFLLSKLKQLKIVESDNHDTVVQSVTCDEYKTCMYGECDSCKNLSVPRKPADNNANTSWYQFKTIKEERNINGVLKTITLTVKK